MRSRTAPASDRSLVIHRHAVPPRPRTIGTSPGSLAWSRESPATPVRTAHGPGNHGGVAGGPVHQISLVPRCWSSRGPFPSPPLPSLTRDPCPGRARDKRKPQGSNPASSDNETTSTTRQKKSSRRTAVNQLTDEVDEMQSTAAMTKSEDFTRHQANKQYPRRSSS
jgi:hypothetical protein